ncbi:MAG TPA: hypothetical protein VIK91_13410 [Nannocystis sp.]
MSIHRSFLPLVALLLASPACKEGEKSDEAAISGLPDEDRKVSDLTVKERQQLCDTTTDYRRREISDEEIRRARCSFEGAFVAVALGGGDVDACVAARDECLAKPMPIAGEEPPRCDFEGKRCTATVGEVEACIEEYVTATQAFFEALDCVRLVSEAGKLEAPEFEHGEACRRIERSCPAMVPKPPLAPKTPPPMGVRPVVE